jgi:hypothetical protein
VAEKDIRIPSWKVSFPSRRSIGAAAHHSVGSTAPPQTRTPGLSS